MKELTHLDQLEAEAIYIIREVAAECENPVMLYSIGKDSSVMLHLAMKAFYPEKPPFPFMHINTTWKFKEMIDFRDRKAEELGIEMIEHINQEGVEQGINPFDHGSAYTDIMKTQALKQALERGDIAGAGLDVFETEPINPDHPLLQFDQVVATPHIGSSSKDTRHSMMTLCAENIEAVLKGDIPRNRVK